MISIGVYNTSLRVSMKIDENERNPNLLPNPAQSIVEFIVEYTR